jgi:hypothetical protein
MIDKEALIAADLFAYGRSYADARTTGRPAPERDPNGIGRTIVENRGAVYVQTGPNQFRIRMRGQDHFAYADDEP